jgi:histidinol-phosphate aminotransferase
MEYNSWHNLPDNVPDGDERHTRDYVYAQRMPDVAEWSDQHHRGHVTSGVRHTVRAPGAVHVAGRRFAALVDIRILRQQGDPFADEDVAVALAGSSLAAMIVEKLAAAVRAAGVDHRIEAFGPAWYRQRLVDWREESAKQPPPTVDGVRAAVRATAAYTPPLPDDDRLRLHLNENHYGPAPACAEALTDITKAPLSFYGVGAHAIEECIAAACGLDATSVFVNHGESAVLRQVFQAAVEPGDVVLLPRLAWAYYGTLASLAGATTACFPVLAGQTEFRYDVEALLGWRGRRPALVVINSPHMPTGQSLPSSDVARIAGAFPDSLILLDEAYAGFDNPGLEDLAAALERHPNLVIARSFSKLYGLADLRIGYGLANPGTTAAIRTAGPLFGLGRPARAAAAAALASSDYYADLSRRVVQSRERLSRALAGTGVLKPYRSHANFLIVHTGHIRPQWLTAELAARGFHVRDCGSYGLDRHLRLSIATEEQTELLGDELTALVEKAGDPPVMPSWL